jgi:predicted ribosome quality control (RQC) complex YloA/Tae2 family protein
MGRFRTATLLLAALAAGLLLAACGSNDNAELLPGTTAKQIESNLDQVRSSVSEENCEAAENAVAEVTTEIDELQKVDKELKKALKQGAAKLSELVSSCGLKEEEAEQAEAEKAQEVEEEEQAVLEGEEEEQAAEEEAEEKKKSEETAKKAKEKAEKEAEQPGPPEEGEESGPKGKAKGHEEEEIELPEEEVIPPSEGGPAGGIGPGAEVGGS